MKFDKTPLGRITASVEAFEGEAETILLSVPKELYTEAHSQAVDLLGHDPDADLHFPYMCETQVYVQAH